MDRLTLSISCISRLKEVGLVRSGSHGRVRTVRFVRLGLVQLTFNYPLVWYLKKLKTLQSRRSNDFLNEVAIDCSVSAECKDQMQYGRQAGLITVSFAVCGMA